MATYHAIRTARLSDSQVLDLIASLRTNLDVTNGKIGFGEGMGVDITASERSEEPIASLDRGRYAIRTVNVSTSSRIHIDFYRGICGDVQDPATNRQASPYFDEVFMRAVDNRGVKASSLEWVKCIDAIEQTLPKAFPLQEFDKGTDAIDVLRAEMAQLSEQHRKMLAGLAEERTEFRKQTEEERAAARQEFAVEKRKLEASAEHQRESFEKYKAEEEANLRQRQEELDGREKELDNRQHMHARRDLRDRIAENFKTRTSRPVVSRSASGKRTAVFTLSLMAGFGLAVGAFFSFEQLRVFGIGDGTPAWLTASYAVRSVILIALALGFVAYAINWLRTIYLDDVRNERRYEKHGHDIDRASFAIETIMEVGDNDRLQVPDIWVEGVCRNLFHDSADQDPDNSPSNALAALFETIAGAKFGPDGAEFSMNRRDARRFAKKIADG